MPSFNDVTAGSSADSSCIQQVIDALKGTAGQGVPISITAVNDAANFALDARNQDTVNGRSFRVRDSSNGTQIQADVNGVTINQLIVSSGTVTGSTFTSGNIVNSTMSLLAASSNNVRVPAVRASHSTAQTVSSNATLVLIFDTEFDNDSLHSTAAGASSRFNPSRAGVWGFGGALSWSGGATGGFVTAILGVNGTAVASQTTFINSTIQQFVSLASEISMSTSDTATISLANITSTTMSISSGAAMWMTYRGAT